MAKAKEINMDYEEYEDMVRTIELQNEALKEFSKSEKSVLIDWRDGATNSYFIPKVIGDESIAKEYLQKEFDEAARVSHERIELLEDKIVELLKANQPPTLKSFFVKCVFFGSRVGLNVMVGLLFWLSILQVALFLFFKR